MKTRAPASPDRGTPSGRDPAPRIRAPRVSPEAFARLVRGRPKPDARKPQTGLVPPDSRPIIRERPRDVPERDVAVPRDAIRDRKPREPEVLEPFSPLPSVVATPSVQPTETAVGASWDRAQVAAMAERMLTSFRSGRVDGRDEVRMQLSMIDAEVRVQIDDGRVLATLVGDGLEGLARTLERELRERGLESEITLARE